MEVKVNIPDQMAQRLFAKGEAAPRRLLEAIAAEGYREELLTLVDVSEILSLSRTETEDFLGRHQVPLVAVDETDLDREAALFDAAARRRQP